MRRTPGSVLIVLIALIALLAACGNSDGQPATGTNADSAICSAAALLNQVRDGPMLRVRDYIEASVDALGDPAPVRPAFALVGSKALDAGDLVANIVYPTNVDLVVDLQAAAGGYAQGAVQAGNALADAPGKASELWWSAMQQFANGNKALSAANDEINRSKVAGTLAC
jgi:hypothetical protein